MTTQTESIIEDAVRSGFEQGRDSVDVEVLAIAVQNARPLIGGPAEWAEQIAAEYARLMRERPGPR